MRAALAAGTPAGITGKAVAPFLMQRLRVSTGGRSLTANMALARNNARLAGILARTLADEG